VIGRSPRRELLRRAGWNIGDQALSSLGNAALSILIARVADAEGYGNFAVAFSIYAFLIGVSQAVANKPYLIRSAAQPDDVARAEARGSTGTALLFGLLCTVTVVPIALFLAEGTREAVIVMAVLLPGLFVQEAWRSVFVARQRPQAAALSDGVWSLLQFVSLAVAIAFGTTEPVPLIAVWALSGWCAALLSVRQGRAHPSPAAGLGYLRRHSDISRFLIAEWVTVVGAGQVALLLVSVIGSVADVGALRGAQTLLGPLNVLSITATAFLVPELVRRPWLTRRGLKLCAFAVSTGIAMANVAWGAGLLLLPTAAGVELLGATWPAARETLLPMTLWSAGLSLAIGPIAVLRARGDTRSSFVVNMLLGPLVLVGAVAGFAFGGAPGTAWGMATAAAVVTPLWWIRLGTGPLAGRPSHPRLVQLP